MKPPIPAATFPSIEKEAAIGGWTGYLWLNQHIYSLSDWYLQNTLKGRITPMKFAGHRESRSEYHQHMQKKKASNECECVTRAEEFDQAPRALNINSFLR